MVGNPETGEKTGFEDISPVKSAWHHGSVSNHGILELARLSHAIQRHGKDLSQSWNLVK
jgi:hypothetical protein